MSAPAHKPARRSFLLHASAVGASVISGVPRTVSAQPPPETTSVRLVHAPAICRAPEYLVEDLLRLEGFTDISYVEMTTQYPAGMVAAGRADFTQDAAPACIYAMDSGEPLVILAGLHVGCYEVFGSERVRAIRALKGKTIAIPGFWSGEHVLMASMLAYVGIDPRKDVRWVTGTTFFNAMELFENAKVDALAAFAPQQFDLRARKLGHVILNTAQDRPWSQYFCCVLTANREFASRHPIAAKRVLRAYLKAVDMCAREPEMVARYLAARNYEPRIAVSQQVLEELAFNRWREDGPENTLRFYAVRLHEVGMVRSNPNKLIAQGTDWRFLRELKKELKV